jgi:hypothetical protein
MLEAPPPLTLVWILAVSLLSKNLQ